MKNSSKNWGKSRRDTIETGRLVRALYCIFVRLLTSELYGVTRSLCVYDLFSSLGWPQIKFSSFGQIRNQYVFVMTRSWPRDPINRCKKRNTRFPTRTTVNRIKRPLFTRTRRQIYACMHHCDRVMVVLADPRPPSGVYNHDRRFPPGVRYCTRSRRVINRTRPYPGRVRAKNLHREGGETK